MVRILLISCTPHFRPTEGRSADSLQSQRVLNLSLKEITHILYFLENVVNDFHNTVFMLFSETLIGAEIDGGIQTPRHPSPVADEKYGVHVGGGGAG